MFRSIASRAGMLLLAAAFPITALATDTVVNNFSGDASGISWNSASTTRLVLASTTNSSVLISSGTLSGPSSGGNGQGDLYLGGAGANATITIDGPTTAVFANGGGNWSASPSTFGFELQGTGNTLTVSNGAQLACYGWGELSRTSSAQTADAINITGSGSTASFNVNGNGISGFGQHSASTTTSQVNISNGGSFYSYGQFGIDGVQSTSASSYVFNVNGANGGALLSTTCLDGISGQTTGLANIYNGGVLQFYDPFDPGGGTGSNSGKYSSFGKGFENWTSQTSMSAIHINGGVLSYKNDGDNVNMDESLTSGARSDGKYSVYYFTWSGSNALRLDNSSAYDTGPYTLANNLGAANYSQLQLFNGSLANPVTVNRLLTVEGANGGSILLDNAVAAIPNGVLLEGAATITASGGVSILSGAISGNGAVTVSNGMLTLTSNDSYSGPTTVASGTLQIGNGGSGAAIGSTSGLNLSGNVALIFNHADTVTFAPVISGNTSLTQSGSGTLFLGGPTDANPNTYTGNTTISGGVLRTNDDFSIGNDNNLAMSGGTLDLFGNGPEVAALNGTGVIGNSQSGASNAAQITVTSGGAFAGSIKDGIGGGNAPVAFFVTGGSLVLSGSSSYSGATTVSAGALHGGAAHALSPNSDVTVSGGTLDVTGYAQTVKSLAIDSSAALNVSVSQLLTSSNAAAFAGTLNVYGYSGGTAELIAYGSYGGGQFGTITGLPNGVSLAYNANQLDLVGSPAGGPSVWAASSGNWSSPGNWSGGVPNAVSAGAVINAPATSPITVTLDEAVTLGSLVLGSTNSKSVTVSGSAPDTLTLNNSGSAATIAVTQGSQEIDAPAILADGLQANISGGTLAFGQASRISGSGPLTMKTAGGTLILGGTDSYSGGTSVNAGTLILASNTALPGGTNLTVAAGGVLIFDPTRAVASPLLSSQGAEAVAPVPEPGTVGLLFAALWSAAIYRRFRRSGKGCL